MTAVKFRDAAESPLWFTLSDNDEIAKELGTWTKATNPA
jgi:hypothetical protein